MRTRTSRPRVQSYEHTSTSTTTRPNGRRQIATSLLIVSSIVSSRMPQIRSTRRKERIPTRLRSQKKTRPKLEKTNLMSIPVRHSRSCSMSHTMRWCGRVGLSMDNRKRFGSIERVLRPVIKDLYLALEAGAISVGFFSQLGTAKSMVCIHLYNPLLLNDHCALNQCIR